MGNLCCTPSGEGKKPQDGPDSEKPPRPATPRQHSGKQSSRPPTSRSAAKDASRRNSVEGEASQTQGQTVPDAGPGDPSSSSKPLGTFPVQISGLDLWAAGNYLDTLKGLGKYRLVSTIDRYNLVAERDLTQEEWDELIRRAGPSSFYENIPEEVTQENSQRETSQRETSSLTNADQDKATQAAIAPDSNPKATEDKSTATATLASPPPAPAQNDAAEAKAIEETGVGTTAAAVAAKAAFARAAD